MDCVTVMVVKCLTSEQCPLVILCKCKVSLAVLCTCLLDGSRENPFLTRFETFATGDLTKKYKFLVNS